MINKHNGIKIFAILQGVIATIYISYYTIGYSIYIFPFIMNSLLLLYILLASFGLWKGKEFGWWLTNIYYMKIITGMVISVIKSYYFQLETVGEIVVSFYSLISFRSSALTILGVIIVVYMFRRSTLNYFNVTNVKMKFILILIIAILWNLIL